MRLALPLALLLLLAACGWSDDQWRRFGAGMSGNTTSCARMAPGQVLCQ